MDEITLDGKAYISSKKAAQIAGYAKDYIGQLCREGRIEARLVGRSWYVYEPSLRKHRFAGEVEEARKAAALSGESSEIANNEAVWEKPVYIQEDPIELPELAQKPEIKTLEETLDQELHLDTNETSEEEVKFSSQIESKPEALPKESMQEISEKAEDREEKHEDTHKVQVHVMRDMPPKAQIRSQEGFVRKERIHRVKKQSFLGRPIILKALSIAVIVLALSVMLIGIGLATPISGVFKNSIIFDYLGGTSYIN